MDWMNEMNQMLLAFERQAVHSLGNMYLVFKRDGRTFGQDFKQYFLETSKERYATIFSSLMFSFKIQLICYVYTNIFMVQ